MDRERDRDAVSDMLEEQDRRRGEGPEQGGPDRGRPGQDDPDSRPIDGQRPPQSEGRDAQPDAGQEAPVSSDPGPFAPH